LWTIAYPGGKAERLTNDLTHYKARIDLQRSAETLAAIESNIVSNIWSVPGGDTSKAKQITSLSLPLYAVTETPNARFLANSADGKLWTFSPDGKQRALFRT